MKKEMRKGLGALLLIGALLTPVLPLGASAFDAGLDQGAEFNLSLGNTGDTGNTGSQDEILEGNSAPQGSGTVEVAGIPVPTYEEFLALSDSEKLALFERLNALDDTTLDNLTPEQQARVEPIFRWSTGQAAESSIWPCSGYVRIEENITVTLKADGTMAFTASDNTTYTIPGVYGEKSCNYIQVHSGYKITLEQEKPDEPWKWKGDSHAIETRTGSSADAITWSQDLKIDTDKTFISVKNIDYPLSVNNSHTITNIGSGAIIETSYNAQKTDVGKVNITNAHLISGGNALRINGDSGSSITGGTFESTGGSAIYTSADLNISGATIKGQTGIEIQGNGSANVTVSNTTITCSGPGIVINDSGSTATLTGCTVNAANMAKLNGTNSTVTLDIKGNNKVTSTGADIMLAGTSGNCKVKTKAKNALGNKPWTIDASVENNKSFLIADISDLDSNCITPYDKHCVIYHLQRTIDSIYGVISMGGA